MAQPLAKPVSNLHLLLDVDPKPFNEYVYNFINDGWGFLQPYKNGCIYTCEFNVFKRNFFANVDYNPHPGIYSWKLYKKFKLYLTQLGFWEHENKKDGFIFSISASKFRKVCPKSEVLGYRGRNQIFKN